MQHLFKYSGGNSRAKLLISFKASTRRFVTNYLFPLGSQLRRSIGLFHYVNIFKGVIRTTYNI